MPQVHKANLFDTHEFIKGLKERGMDEKQAEFLAKHQMDVLNAHIASRADVFTVKKDLEEKIEKSHNRTIGILGVAMAFIAILIAFK